MTASPLTPREAHTLAEEAYTYGFAMVENHRTIHGMCVDPASPQYAGFNHYLHGRRLFDPDYTLIVTPNNDTLYSTTFADLRAEPLVITVPPTGDRYFVIQLVDMGTDNFAYIGTRSTGRDGGDFLLVGPTTKGSLDPAPFDRVIVAPSQFVALATRTALDGPDDLPGAAAFQDALQLRPLSAFLGTPAPDPAPAITGPAPFLPRDYGTPALLDRLGAILRWHTVPAHESELLARLARIGIGPFVTFDLDAFEPDVRAAIEEGCAEAHRRIEGRGNSLGVWKDGWEDVPAMGHFGSDFLFRSAVAWRFIYTNDREEALYPPTSLDADGEPLVGSRSYEVRFPAGGLPPVEAFWSITLYDAVTRLMVHNPIERYSIGDRTPGIRFGEDGSLTIHIRSDDPGPDLAPNWLPAPEGAFTLIARAYIPQAPLLDGRYRFPPVVRVAT